MDAADRRMSRLRADMVWEHPFWGFHALRLKLVRDDAGRVTQTMATNGDNIYWSPDFIAELSDAEVTGVIVHEIYHVLCMHHLRFGQRIHALWNAACDYAINPLLIAAGFTLPEDRLEDAAFKGMDAEQIYDLLRENATVIQVSWGEMMLPTHKDGTPLTQEEVNAAEIDLRLSITEAAKLVGPSGFGTSAAAIERLVEKAKEETVDWREVLRTFISKNGPITGSTWRRPGRRGMGVGIMLPSPVREATPEIAVLVDTSGSINREALGQFTAEIDAINRETNPERITFGYGGTSVIDTMVLEVFDEAPTNLKGGGGTNLQAMVDEMVEAAPNAAMLVVLTDLCCLGMDKAPDIPVLWVCWGVQWPMFVRHTKYGEIVPMTKVA